MKRVFSHKEIIRAHVIGPLTDDREVTQQDGLKHSGRQNDEKIVA